MKKTLIRIPYTTSSDIPNISDSCIKFLHENPHVSLNSIGYNFYLNFKNYKKAFILLVEDKEELIHKLREVNEGNYKSVSVYPGNSNLDLEVAFLATGGGGQYPNMGLELYKSEPVFKDAIDECSEIALTYFEHDVRKVLFPKDNNEIGDLVHRIDYMYITLFTFEYAVYKLWKSYGLKCNVVVGHSIGEIAASFITGVLSLEDAIKLACRTGSLIQGLKTKGKMIAIRAQENVVNEFIKDYRSSVSVALVNNSLQTIISGDPENLDLISKRLEKAGYDCKTIPMSHACHSPLILPVIEEYKALIESLAFSEPKMNFISCITGNSLVNEVLETDFWVKQLTESVRFMDASKELRLLNLGFYVELGPSPILLGIIEHDLKDNPTNLLPSADKSDPYTFYESLAQWIVDGGITTADELGFFTDETSQPAVFKQLFEDVEALLSNEKSTSTTRNQNTALDSVEIAKIIEKEIVHIIYDNEAASVPPNVPLNELGMTSLHALKLTKRLNKILSLRITVSNLFNYPTLVLLTEFLCKKKNKLPEEDLLSTKRKHENLDSLIKDIDDLTLDELNEQLEIELKDLSL